MRSAIQSPTPNSSVAKTALKMSNSKYKFDLQKYVALNTKSKKLMEDMHDTRKAFLGYTQASLDDSQ